jgi:hypothetical protein
VTGAPPDAGSAGEPGPAAADGLGGAAGEVWQAARARLGSAIDLAAAEAELAVRAGVGILVLAALACLALLTGWGFVIDALAGAAIAAGLAWPVVLLGLGLLHFAVAAGLLALAARLGRDLTLPALRRALRGDGD